MRETRTTCGCRAPTVDTTPASAANRQLGPAPRQHHGIGSFMPGRPDFADLGANKRPLVTAKSHCSIRQQPGMNLRPSAAGSPNWAHPRAPATRRPFRPAPSTSAGPGRAAPSRRAGGCARPSRGRRRRWPSAAVRCVPSQPIRHIVAARSPPRLVHHHHAQLLGTGACEGASDPSI